MAMIPFRTAPPTLKWQPSMSWRLNDLPTVLPLTAISMVEPVGICSTASGSACVMLPKNPWATNRPLISLLIFLFFILFLFFFFFFFFVFFIFFFSFYFFFFSYFYYFYFLFFFIYYK